MSDTGVAGIAWPETGETESHAPPDGTVSADAVKLRMPPPELDTVSR